MRTRSLFRLVPTLNKIFSPLKGQLKIRQKKTSIRPKRKRSHRIRYPAQHSLLSCLWRRAGDRLWTDKPRYCPQGTGFESSQVGCWPVHCSKKVHKTFSSKAVCIESVQLSWTAQTRTPRSLHQRPHPHQQTVNRLLMQGEMILSAKRGSKISIRHVLCCDYPLKKLIFLIYLWQPSC